eukprot:ctg_2785.g519
MNLGRDGQNSRFTLLGAGVPGRAAVLGGRAAGVSQRVSCAAELLADRAAARRADGVVAGAAAVCARAAAGGVGGARLGRAGGVAKAGEGVAGRWRRGGEGLADCWEGVSDASDDRTRDQDVTASEDASTASVIAPPSDAEEHQHASGESERVVDAWLKHLHQLRTEASAAVHTSSLPPLDRTALRRLASRLATNAERCALASLQARDSCRRRRRR